MPREEEQENVNTGVLLKPRSYQIKAVPAIAIGSCYINTIEFIYPWNTSTRVNSVPVGERFDFVVNYSAQNTVGGITDMWGLSIVWWDDVGDIEGYYFRTCSSTVANQNEARIANAYTLLMPNHAVTLHFNMFMNDDHAPAQLYPARPDWAKLKI